MRCEHCGVDPDELALLREKAALADEILGDWNTQEGFVELSEYARVRVVRWFYNATAGLEREVQMMDLPEDKRAWLLELLRDPFGVRDRERRAADDVERALHQGRLE